MSYCLNPECPKPHNPPSLNTCQSCGASLLLQKRYRIKQELGRGGFGATFLAVDESLPGHPSCVIKQLQPAASSPHMLKMARDLFEREAKTLGRVGDHPQVPRLLNYFEDRQEFYLVQEYISGSTLQQEVKRSGPFSEAGVKQFLSEILPMIKYIHSQDVIHRDIKPANLIRREQDKKLVLIDFGAVKDEIKPQQAATSEQTALTQYAIGTPGYAPPEQMAMRPIFASDVYALGVTCLYLLTGRSPKDMDYDTATGELMWHEYVHISHHFSKVLKRMLEVSPRHRYQSADDVLRALDLVPYMDSLAEGMVSSPTHRGQHDLPHSSELGHSAMTTGTPSSPSARLAAQIRARKHRKIADSTPYASRNGYPRSTPLTGNHGMGGRSGMVSSSRGRPGAMSPQQSTRSADSILASYSRGRRNFSSCDLSLLNFQQANLAGANFHQANFRQARLMRTNLQQADLGGVNFSQALLREAVLKDANLVGAFLTNADLAKADLRGANLSYAHLSHANLRGANLCGADLTGAKITDDQLAMARTNWKTIHPNKKRTLW